MSHFLLSDTLRQSVVDAFNDASLKRPRNGANRNATEYQDAATLLRYEPAWVIPSEVVDSARHGLEAMSANGVRYVLGRIMLYCIDQPDSDVVDTFVLYLSRAHPEVGPLFKLFKALTVHEASVVGRVLAALARERNSDKYLLEKFALAKEASAEIIKLARGNDLGLSTRARTRRT